MTINILNADSLMIFSSEFIAFSGEVILPKKDVKMMHQLQFQREHLHEHDHAFFLWILYQELR